MEGSTTHYHVIVIAALALLGLILITMLVKSVTLNTCDRYRGLGTTDVPHSCIQYLMEQK